ncbi:Nn.00g067940.m01.CDS01 [Neocucurbitaria sp. VM-36]
MLDCAVKDMLQHDIPVSHLRTTLPRSALFASHSLASHLRAVTVHATHSLQQHALTTTPPPLPVGLCLSLPYESGYEPFNFSLSHNPALSDPDILRLVIPNHSTALHRPKQERPPTAIQITNNHTASSPLIAPYMSTSQSTASPRPPRGNPRPPPQSATQPLQANSARQSQRKPRGNRAYNGHTQSHAAVASPSRPPTNADPAFSDSAILSSEEAQMPKGPRNPKKHTQSQPSLDRLSSSNAPQAPLTDTEAATNNPSATPAKVHGAYAGPTFHASPAPSALPIPKFLSRSVPAKTRAGPLTPPPEDSSDSAGSPSPSLASPSRAPIPVPSRHQDSPLDMLFKADKAERAKNNHGNPASTNFLQPSIPVRPQHYKQDSFNSSNGVFPIELDGASKDAHLSPPAASPAAHRSVTDPCQVPQLQDSSQPNNGNDVMQDLFNRLSMSQKNLTSATPPRPDGQVPSNPQSRNLTPSPFHDGRPTTVRSASGPSTPTPSAQEPSDFFYGNRNLSPLFKAAKGDNSKRNSGLRTEITADSPVIAQGLFQDFSAVPPPKAMDPNTFTRSQPGNNNEGPVGPRRGSAPFVQPYQQGPNNRRRTPGRQSYQHRPDSYPARNNPNGSAPRPGKAVGNAPLVSAPKPSTSMMSFVPASVAAKPKQQATSTPPSIGTPPPMKVSNPSDTLALEQDLKRLLNLKMTGDTSSVRYSVLGRKFGLFVHFASRFFRDGPSQDEKTANAEASFGIDFDAGIQDHGLRMKTSRFLLRKNKKLDKPLPAPPSNVSSSTLVTPSLPVDVDHGDQSDDASSPEKPLPFPPAPHDSCETSEITSAVGYPDKPMLKLRTSFATLRTKSSHIFSNKNLATDAPSVPPVPQIPVETSTFKSRRPVLTPLHVTRGSRSSIASLQGRSISISRPTLTAQLSNQSILEHPFTVPFTKPTGPAPPRPPRPDSLDEETVAFMQDSGTRMCLPTSNRVSASTATCSTPRSHASSIEARLGFPSGHGIPSNYSLDSPLAARFPQDPLQPLPVSDSTGSTKGYSRFSEYLMSQHPGYAVDGVDVEDREVGPIEQYRRSKEGDWTLERRVSKGPTGNPGMLFRDRWGGFHFVADI